MSRSLTDADVVQAELDARGRDAVWSVVASGIDSKNLVPPFLSRGQFSQTDLVCSTLLGDSDPFAGQLPHLPNYLATLNIRISLLIS
jgi:hypothetical protein